jgi:lipoate-protein ligase A
VTRELWRYLDSGPQRGALNMATDEVMLDAHLRGEIPPTLRVYTWRPRAISLGRFQEAEASVDLEECRRLGVDVVRRPTGGRAILHTEDEVTFSIVVSEKLLGRRGVMECYRALARSFVAGLRLLGVDARLVERSANAPRRAAAQDPACFAVKARCDLVVGSEKLLGSAQLHHDGVVLQQNSLPLRIPLEDWGRLFRRKPVAPAALGLRDAAGAELGYQQVAGALKAGLEEVFGAQLVAGELSEWETARAAALAPAATVAAAGVPGS